MPDLIAEDPSTKDLTRTDALLANAPWKRFAVLGDSHAFGVREAFAGYPDRSWSEWVVEGLSHSQPELAAQNFGKIGLLTREVRAQQLAPALAFEPDLAVVLCGGNDLLRGSYDGVADELGQMVAALQEHGSLVVTMGLFDMTRSDLLPDELKPPLKEQLDELYEIVEGVAARYGTVHLDFGKHPASADRSIYASDYQHLTTRGHAIVAAEMIRRLSELS